MADDSKDSLGADKTYAGAVQPASSKGAASLGDERTSGDVLLKRDGIVDEFEVANLASRYAIERTLGQGGMGCVLLAKDMRLDRNVAMKRILGEAAGNQRAVQRFLTEAKSIAALNHPNIVQIYDYGRAEDGPFLIMEYLEGGSLLDKCKAGPIPLDEAIELVCQICDGLAKAHDSGIIHRDIKPANILLTQDGIPKLTDFGLAKAHAGDGGHTMAGAVLGTPDFMPPEQRRDASEVDARSDLWSLAATLYQLMTGRSPKVIRLHDVPATVQPVLEKALEDEKNQRYATVREFRDALRMAAGLATDKVSVSHVKTVEGQCSACGKINNDHSRKFCRHCRASLRAPCLFCDQDMPVWDAVCGECGAEQSSCGEQRRAHLLRQQQMAKDFYSQYDFAQAIVVGSQLGSLRHPNLVKFAKWGQAFVAAVTTRQSQVMANVVERLAEARAHAEASEYAAAVRSLESIPTPLRDSSAQVFLAECRDKRDRAAELVKLIAARVKAKDLDGLLPEVDKAITLQGHRADLQRLRQQLQAREAKRRQAGDSVPAQTESVAHAEGPNQAQAPTAVLHASSLTGVTLSRAGWAGVAAGSSMVLIAVGVALFAVGRRPVDRAPVDHQQSAPTPPVASAVAVPPLKSAADAAVPGDQSRVASVPSWLGVSYESLPEVTAQSLNTEPGRLVAAFVFPEGPAAKAGMERGDILTGFDGASVDASKDFNALGIGGMAAGSQHTVTVVRHGRELALTVVLEPKPTESSAQTPLRYNEIWRAPLAGLAETIVQQGATMCCSAGDRVAAWNATNAGLKTIIETKGSAIDVTSDGATAVVAGKNGSLAIWSMVTGQQDRVLAEDGDEDLQECRIDGRGKRVAVMYRNGMLRIWDAQTGTLAGPISLPKECSKQGMTSLFSWKLGPFSASGGLVIIGTGTDVLVWNLDSRTVEWSWHSDRAITAFAPSPDWSQCAVGTENGVIKLVSMRDGSVLATLRGHEKSISSIAWHGGEWLASASDPDRSARVWSVRTGNPVWEFTIQQTPNNLFYFGPRAICFDSRSPGVFVGSVSVSHYKLPAIPEGEWKVAPVPKEAVDFASSLKRPALTIKSGATGTYVKGRIETNQTFSDGSQLKGVKTSGAAAWVLSFTDADRQTPLDGAVGMEIDDTGSVTAIAQASLVAAGIGKDDEVLGLGESETGPFYRIPTGATEADELLRLRLLAGRRGSVVWLRVKTAGSETVRTVSVPRDANAAPWDIEALRTRGALFEARTRLGSGGKEAALKLAAQAVDRNTPVALAALREPALAPLSDALMRDCRSRFDAAVAANDVGLAAVAHAEASVLDPRSNWWGDFLTPQRMSQISGAVASSIPAKAVLAIPPLTNSVGMQFKLIPPGTFPMGGRGNARVTITKAFYIGTHEVTRNQSWDAMPGKVAASWKGDDHPVGDVAWGEVIEFCRVLSSLPRERDAGRTYRLPTEAEWEYACRSGTTTQYAFGDDGGLLSEYAWFEDNSGLRTHPVGQKKPNNWGLYDMHGNVFEWCSDWYADLGKGEASDPQGLTDGTYRTYRGSSCNSPAWNCKSEGRFKLLPANKGSDLGFRLVLIPSATGASQTKQ